MRPLSTRALLVCRALPRGDLIEGAPLGLHTDVRVPGEHCARDVAGDAHDHLITGARLGELRDQRVAVIVPAALHPGLLADLYPRRLEPA